MNPQLPVYKCYLAIPKYSATLITLGYRQIGVFFISCSFVTIQLLLRICFFFLLLLELFLFPASKERFFREMAAWELSGNHG